MELLSSWPILLIHDPDILSLKDTYLEKGRLNLDTINLIKRIQTKISIQESSSNWKSKLYLYSPSIHRMVSENDAKLYEDEDLKREVKSGWHVEKIEGQEGDRFVFSWFSLHLYVRIRSGKSQNGYEGRVRQPEHRGYAG